MPNVSNDACLTHSSELSHVPPTTLSESSKAIIPLRKKIQNGKISPSFNYKALLGVRSYFYRTQFGQFPN